jgi:hypothetical protein
MAGRWNHSTIVVVEVPLAQESKPKINYQCHSYSGAIKTMPSKRLGMGQESQLYLLSFAPLVSMMVRKGCLGTSLLGVNTRGTNCLRELGGHALCGEGSNWLGSMTGPHTMEVWTGMYNQLCSKALISFGRTHLCRV